MASAGYCAKYGQGKMLSLALVAPAIIGGLINYYLHQDIESASLAAVYSSVSGLAGFAGVTIAHEELDRYFKKTRIGLRKRSKIAKRVQLIAYAVPATLLLLFTGVPDHSPKNATLSVNAKALSQAVAPS